MVVIFLVYGLAFFSLGLVVALEARRPSALALSRHLPWLAAFGVLHALVEWCDLLLLVDQAEIFHTLALGARSAFLPISAALLVRFGSGLNAEAGPLPAWLTLAPAALMAPAALLVAYALVMALTEPPLALAADVWSRYLLYLPGCVLTAIGFWRQARRLPQAGLGHAGPLLMGAAVAFGINAVVAGLVVPAAPYGLAGWLNVETLEGATGVPVQVWRTLSALAVTLFVIRAMGVFEAERGQELARLSEQRERSQQAALAAQAEARHTAEAWTDALVALNRRIAQLEDVDLILQEVVALARPLLEADTATLALWNADGTQLEVKWIASADGTQAAQIPVRGAVILQAVAKGQPCCYPQDVPPGTPGLEDGWLCPVLKVSLAAVAIVPLLLNGRPIGGLWVGRGRGERFNPNDVQGLGHLADQAVIAIQHALMAAQMQSLAVVEERGRLAREMHDGLAQVLGYLSLQVQTLEALVRRGDTGAALAELRQTRANILEAQADVRENILSLRTTLAGETSLLKALQAYADEFEVQTGVQTDVMSEIGEDTGLSPLAEAQLVRIAQEALTNVRKHARATQVQVRLTGEAGGVHLIVHDDGRGMPSLDPRSGHFGLPMMRERAEHVGGSLRVNSLPGEGTQLDVWLPLAAA